MSHGRVSLEVAAAAEPSLHPGPDLGLAPTVVQVHQLTRAPWPQWGSGLLQGPRQLFDLAAWDHPQGAPSSLVQLGLQGAAEVIDLHVGQ